MNTPKPAVILLSGGLDSATTLAIAKSEGYVCHALSFDYGQRHQHELVAATAIAQSLHADRHIIAKIDLRAFGGSALTANIPVPKDQIMPPGAAAPHHPKAGEIPITYVPARNTVFLSFALAWAEVLHSFDIFIGVNAIDYSGYPDCRPEFIRAFENLANLATAAGVEGKGKFHIHTPLIDKTKSQIIQWGQQLGVNYALTHSCYDPITTADGKGGMTTVACGHCDSCQLRRQGFQQAGFTDPIPYAS